MNQPPVTSCSPSTTDATWIDDSALLSAHERFAPAFAAIVYRIRGLLGAMQLDGTRVSHQQLASA